MKPRTIRLPEDVDLFLQDEAKRRSRDHPVEVQAKNTMWGGVTARYYTLDLLKEIKELLRE